MVPHSSEPDEFKISWPQVPYLMLLCTIGFPLQVLVTTKLFTEESTKLIGERSTRRIYKVDSHIGILPAGLPADGRALAQKAMELCRSHRQEFGVPIPGRVLAERLGDFMHSALLRWGQRAYPNSVLIACYGGDSHGNGDDLSVRGEEENEELTLSEDLSTEGIEYLKGKGDELLGVEVDARSDSAGEGECSSEKGDDDSCDVGDAIDEVRKDAGAQLYMVESNGVSYRYSAACAGQGSAGVRKWFHRRRRRVRGEGQAVAEGPVAQLTCEEAVRAMLDAAQRMRDEDDVEVECLPEVGWVSSSDKAREDRREQTPEGREVGWQKRQSTTVGVFIHRNTHNT
ncbi:unnamed protein product [Choristocarpus tenellus]